MKTLIKIYLLLVVLILLSACTPAINIQFTSSAYINPDFKNRALPTLLRIYQLSQATSFNDATFHQLWLNDEQILGASLIKRQEFELNPNSTITVKVVPEINTHYLGIIALYRNPKHSRWRLIKIMPNSMSAVFSHISIKVSGDTLTFINDNQDANNGNNT